MLTPAVREHSIKIIKEINIFHYRHNEKSEEIPLKEELQKAEDPEKYLKEQFNNSGWVRSENINGENILLSFEYEENGVKIIENYNSGNEKEGFITYKRMADVLLERSLF